LRAAEDRGRLHCKMLEELHVLDQGSVLCLAIKSASNELLGIDMLPQELPADLVEELAGSYDLRQRLGLRLEVRNDYLNHLDEIGVM